MAKKSKPTPKTACKVCGRPVEPATQKEKKQPSISVKARNDWRRSQKCLGFASWFRMDQLAETLEALGRKDLADRCFEDMSPEMAEAFGADLWDLIRELYDHYDQPERKRPTGAFGDVFTYDAKQKDWVRSKRRISFELAMGMLTDANIWYDHVASLGYGVVAKL